jgi:hypothetical protein
MTVNDASSSSSQLRLQTLHQAPSLHGLRRYERVGPILPKAELWFSQLSELKHD